MSAKKSWVHGGEVPVHRRDIADLPPMETFGPGLFPQSGLALLIGEPGTGKSTLMASLARMWPNPIAGLYAGRQDPDEAERDGASPGWVATLRERRGRWRERNLYVAHLAFEDADNMLRAEACRTSLAHDARGPSGGYPWVDFRGAEEVTVVRHPDGTYSLPMYELITPDEPADLTEADSTTAFLRELSVHYELPTDWVPDQSTGELVERTVHPDILILDNLSYCIGDKSANDDTTARGLVAGIKRLQKWFGAALVVCIHHPTAGTKSPFGSKVLAAQFDCMVHLSRKGDVLTAENTKARGFASNAKRKYQRRIVEWTDFVSESLACVEFDDVTDQAPTGKPAAATVAKAAAPAPAKPATAPAEAAPVPQAPAHPADALRGLPRVAWQVVALDPGAHLSTTYAEKLVTEHACFESIEPRRRAERFRQVLTTWAGKGLADLARGVVMNPT